MLGMSVHLVASEKDTCRLVRSQILVTPKR